LDLGFGAADQHSAFGSVHNTKFDFDILPTPGDFEAFKAFFCSGPADTTITDCNAPGIVHEAAQGSTMTHLSVATPDACLRTLWGAATSGAEVPSVPHPHSAPCLLKALQQQNLDALTTALTEDPDSATIPFIEHNMEPPVCAAVRMRCPAAMVAVLLEFGADPQADDMWGNTAMQHLQRQKRTRASSLEYMAEVEELLLAKGAKLDCNLEPSVDELMLQSALAPWPSNVLDGVHGSPQLHREWHLQWTCEQVEDLAQLENMLRSDPVGSNHMTGVVSCI
jgi:hypothetical protein